MYRRVKTVGEIDEIFKDFNFHDSISAEYLRQALYNETLLFKCHTYKTCYQRGHYYSTSQTRLDFFRNWYYLADGGRVVE